LEPVVNALSVAKPNPQFAVPDNVEFPADSPIIVLSPESVVFKVSVVPEPLKDVLDPADGLAVKVNELPVKPPPVSPVSVIEEAEGDDHVAGDPVVAVNT
jgi:hypothetical protein